MRAVCPYTCMRLCFSFRMLVIVQSRIPAIAATFHHWRDPDRGCTRSTQLKSSVRVNLSQGDLPLMTAAAKKIVNALRADGVLTLVEVMVVQQRLDEKGEQHGHATLRDLMSSILNHLPDEIVEKAMLYVEAHTHLQDEPAPSLYLTRRMACKALHHSGFAQAAVRDALTHLRQAKGYRTPAPRVDTHRIGLHHRKPKVASLSVKCCPDNEVFELAELAGILFPSSPANRTRFCEISWHSYTLDEDSRAISAYRREQAAKQVAMA